MNEVSINDILHSNKFLNKKVSISGWVKTFRANRFIALNDGSGLGNLQCVIDFENTDDEILRLEHISLSGRRGVTCLKKDEHYFADLIEMHLSHQYL